MNDNILVKLKNAGFRIKNKWLVQSVSFQVEKGKIVTLIGPNGSGKSTTAKIALGIFKKIEGEVEKYTNKVGYVPQKISIDWTLPLRVSDFMVLTENIKNEDIDEALSLTGVIHLKNKNLGNLSGGEFQRVLLARAISKKPELLVLDEPVQGVDFTGEIALYELIKKISDERLSNIFAFTIIFIALLSQLELYTPIKDLSDSFRNWAYGNTSYLYDSDKRDIALVGNIRPKVFAPEPSTHTILLSCLILCYKFLRAYKLTAIDFVIIILCVAVYFATISPSLFLAIAIYILLSVNWFKDLPLKMIPVMLIFIILVLIGGIELDVFSRFYSFGDINEVSSVNVRVLYPILTMLDVIQQ